MLKNNFIMTYMSWHYNIYKLLKFKSRTLTLYKASADTVITVVVVFACQTVKCVNESCSFLTNNEKKYINGIQMINECQTYGSLVYLASLNPFQSVYHLSFTLFVPCVRMNCVFQLNSYSSHYHRLDRCTHRVQSMESKTLFNNSLQNSKSFFVIKVVPFKSFSQSTSSSNSRSLQSAPYT